MAQFHDDMRALAAELVDEFGSGRSATLYRAVTTYDPFTQAETHGETAVAIKVVTPANRLGRDDEMVADDDVRAVVPAAGLALVPQAGDQITLPQRTGRFIVGSPVTAISPDGDPIAYRITCRRPG